MAIYQEKFSKTNHPTGFYVYLYLREDSTPYYVGKGKGRRAWDQHRVRNRGVMTPNDPTRILIFQWDLTEVWAFILERKLIHWFGRRDNATGALQNKTAGGQGVSDDTNLKAAHAWLRGLSEQEKKDYYIKQAEKRSKGWYVSRVEDPKTETFVLNIAEWCRENGIDSSCPSQMQGPNAKLKSIKGWRIRRSDMPPLSPYTDKRKIGHANTACKGKGWRLVDGKREWYEKH